MFEFIIGSLIIAVPVLLIVLLVWMVKKRRKREEAVFGKISLLPLWDTVGASYRLAWENRAEYFRISRCWLALALAAIFAYVWILWPTVSTVLCIDFTQMKANGAQMKATLELQQGRLLLLSCLGGAVWLVAGSSIAVAWHRLILRNERTSATCYLRFDRVVWNYLALGLLIFCLGQLPTLAALVLGSDGGPAVLLIRSLILLVLDIGICLFMIRVPVLLPAKALAVEDLTIRGTLGRTRSNFWRLFWGQLFCILPIIPASFLMRAGCGDPVEGPILYAVGTWLGFLLILPVLLSFLSLAYRHFFETEPQA